MYKRQAVHHGTRQHCNDAELLRPRYFPFRTGGNLSLIHICDTVEVDYNTESGQIRTKAYTVMGIVNEYSYSGFSKCFALPEQFMNEATPLAITVSEERG